MEHLTHAMNLDPFYEIARKNIRAVLSQTNQHMHNFIQCVRSRQQPLCNVEVGHRSATVCHIGNIAIRTGQRLRWDPRAERFVDNEEADRWLSRPMRAPWRLDA